MKKIVKPLVIAASVAAIAGIGAVSFAAWAGGSKTTEDVNATTGHVSQLSFNDTAATAVLTGLLPYDQNGTTNLQTTTAKTLGTVTFAAITTTGFDGTNYYINVEATPASTNGIAWTGTDGKTTNVYVSITEPTAAISSIGSDWEKVNVSGGATLEIPVATTTPVFYVILESDDVAQMDKAFELNFTLKESNT